MSNAQELHIHFPESEKDNFASPLTLMIVETLKASVPIWHKANLTVKEAAEYSGIGETSIREMIKDDHTSFSFQVGSKWLINRKLFDEYIIRLCSER